MGHGDGLRHTVDVAHRHLFPLDGALVRARNLQRRHEGMSEGLMTDTNSALAPILPAGSLSGRVALVTRAAAGICAGITTALEAPGATVAAIDPDGVWHAATAVPCGHTSYIVTCYTGIADDL